MEDQVFVQVIIVPETDHPVVVPGTEVIDGAGIHQGMTIEQPAVVGYQEREVIVAVAQTDDAFHLTVGVIVVVEVSSADVAEHWAGFARSVVINAVHVEAVTGTVDLRPGVFVGVNTSVGSHFTPGIGRFGMKGKRAELRLDSGIYDYHVHVQSIVVRIDSPAGVAISRGGPQGSVVTRVTLFAVSPVSDVLKSNVAEPFFQV